MTKEQLGSVEIEDNRATLTFTRLVKASPEKVWNTLTNPAEFGIWYNATAEIEPRVGGTFVVHSGPFNWNGPILEWQPEKIFKYEHNHDAVPEMPSGASTTVTWTLVSKDNGTEVTFTQSGLPSTAGFMPGTHVVVDRLVAHAEDREMPDFGDYYNEVEPLYEVWDAPNEA